MGSLGKGILGFLEIIGESLETYNKYNKDLSVEKVRRYTTTGIAEHYRTLINDVDRMTAREKELVFAELAVQFGQQDKLKGIEDKAIRLERENVVLKQEQRQGQYNDDWTKEEVKEFDTIYNRYSTGLWSDTTEGDLARKIMSFANIKRNLSEIMERVQRYKAMGL